jgi:uncharacterized protein YdeI (YjbR/CyaY-like superfamily)
MNPRVDDFLNKAEKWRKELEMLRMMMLDCGLTEELKWSVPIYTSQGKNIVGINGFKEFCALSFFKGALLEDTGGLFSKPGTHTQAGRWIKFTGREKIIELEPVLKAYIYEAIEVEKAGLKVTLKKTEDYPVPEELQTRLDGFPALRAAFNALTPGRKRGYLLYFADAKQAKTREARIEKYIPHILNGKGMTDR